MNSMYIALGYRCNHRCLFCPCGKNKAVTLAAPISEILSAIENGVSKQNVTHITISGGEPTLHPDFRTILEFCVDRNMEIGILSNGENFYRTDNVERYFGGLPAKAIHVTTAIHSDLEELHEKVTRVAGSFSRTVSGLKNVMSIGIPVTVKQVISRWNYQRLPNFVDFVFREYGQGISLTFCGMDFCGMQPEQIHEVASSFFDIGSCLEMALDLVISLREKYRAFPFVTVADLPLCCADPYYWGFFTKSSRCALAQYSAPNSDENKVFSNYNVVNDCDTFFKACGDCSVSELCPGAWRTAYEYFGEEAVRPISSV